MHVVFKEDKLFGLGTESHSLCNIWSIMSPWYLGGMLVLLPSEDPTLQHLWFHALLTLLIVCFLKKQHMSH